MNALASRLHNSLFTSLTKTTPTYRSDNIVLDIKQSMQALTFWLNVLSMTLDTVKEETNQDKSYIRKIN